MSQALPLIASGTTRETLSNGQPFNRRWEVRRRPNGTIDVDIDGTVEWVEVTRWLPVAWIPALRAALIAGARAIRRGGRSGTLVGYVIRHRGGNAWIQAEGRCAANTLADAKRFPTRLAALLVRAKLNDSWLDARILPVVRRRKRKPEAT